jgi:hypothetical protein
MKVNLEITPKGEEKKSYIPNSRLVNVFASAWVSMASPLVLSVPHRDSSGWSHIQNMSEGRETWLSWVETSFSDRVREGAELQRI